MRRLSGRRLGRAWGCRVLDWDGWECETWVHEWRYDFMHGWRLGHSEACDLTIDLAYQCSLPSLLKNDLNISYW